VEVERRGVLGGCVYVMSQIIPRVASTNPTSTCIATRYHSATN